MAGKLDQSLDEILSTRRTAGRGRGRAGRRAASGRAVPTGGIQKNIKTTGKAAGKVTAPISSTGDSKIIVSNLVGLSHLSLAHEDTNAYSLLTSTKARSRYVEQQSKAWVFLAVFI